MTNLNRSLQIFFWSYAFLYVVISSLQITQIDLWYQLAEGLHILNTWTLPTAPPAAYGLPATPYFDEYAGYEVVLVLLFKLGGFVGLWMVFAAVYLAIVFLPIATSGRKYPAFDFSSTLALLFAGILMRERLEQRPELVAGLLLVLLMVILRKSALEKVTARTLVGLFFLFVVWTNTHSSFIIGFFTMGLWGICEIALKFRKVPPTTLLKGALAMGGVALIASMVNPYGPHRLLFPFVQAFDPGSTALSPEMWPIDFSTFAGKLVVIAILLLAWGLLTTRGVPLWLILFSLFAVFISFKSLRFINYLAIALLFVYAARIEASDARKALASMPWRILHDVALCLLCVFLIFGDAFSFIFTYDEMRGESRLGTHTRRFAEDICAMHVSDSSAHVPVLCGHGVGSYLSFGTNQFQPMLDSGLSHFSDDTKRYFFFLWHKPEAFALGLKNLRVNYILIEKDTFHWIPAIHSNPDWEFVTCTGDGMLWKRSPGLAPLLVASQRELIEKSGKDLLEKGETVGAFGYSTLVDPPGESLALLAKYNSREWPESLFNAVCKWVDAQPPDALRNYLASKHSVEYPLVDAIVAERLSVDAFSKFVATNPRGPRPWFWKALEVRDCLRRGDMAHAQAIFDSISPTPVSSVTYYELWHKVHADDTNLSAYGRWQTWDSNAQQFMKTMSSRLNARISELDSQAAR